MKIKVSRQTGWSWETLIESCLWKGRNMDPKSKFHFGIFSQWLLFSLAGRIFRGFPLQTDIIWPGSMQKTLLPDETSHYIPCSAVRFVSSSRRRQKSPISRLYTLHGWATPTPRPLHGCQALTCTPVERLVIRHLKTCVFIWGSGFFLHTSCVYLIATNGLGQNPFHDSAVASCFFFLNVLEAML